MDGMKVAQGALKFEKILRVKGTADINIERNHACTVRHSGNAANDDKLNAMFVKSADDSFKIRRRNVAS